MKTRIGFFLTRGVALAAAFALTSPTPVSRAAAPQGRYVLTSNTVLDQETGLVWQRVADNTTRSLAEAESYCPGVTLPGNGWRLPSIKELQTIADETLGTPSIDPVFNSPDHFQFWSSSRYPDFPEEAWYVWFGYGQSAHEGDTVFHSVRCVR